MGTRNISHPPLRDPNPLLRGHALGTAQKSSDHCRVTPDPATHDTSLGPGGGGGGGVGRRHSHQGGYHDPTHLGSAGGDTSLPSPRESFGRKRKVIRESPLILSTATLFYGPTQRGPSDDRRTRRVPPLKTTQGIGWGVAVGPGTGPLCRSHLSLRPPLGRTTGSMESKTTPYFLLRTRTKTYPLRFR